MGIHMEPTPRRHSGATCRRSITHRGRADSDCNTEDHADLRHRRTAAGEGILRDLHTGRTVSFGPIGCGRFFNQFSDHRASIVSSDDERYFAVLAPDGTTAVHDATGALRINVGRYWLNSIDGPVALMFDWDLPPPSPRRYLNIETGREVYVGRANKNSSNGQTFLIFDESPPGLRDATTLRDTQLNFDGDAQQDIDISMDGRYLVMRRRGMASLFDVAAQRETPLNADESSSVYFYDTEGLLSFRSPPGARVRYLRTSPSEGLGIVWDLDTGRQAPIDSQDLLWSPNRRYVLVSAMDGRAMVRDLHSTAPDVTLDVPLGEPNSTPFISDTMVAFNSSGAKTIYSIDGSRTHRIEHLVSNRFTPAGDFWIYTQRMAPDLPHFSFQYDLATGVTTPLGTAYASVPSDESEPENHEPYYLTSVPGENNGPSVNYLLRDPRVIAQGRGGALRANVCRLSADYIDPFSASVRDEATASDNPNASALYADLKGRPWNPCDWRGLLAVFPNRARGDGWFEGMRQWLRLISVRWNLGGRDYACEETTSAASAETRARRARMCERFAAPAAPVPT